MSSTLRKSKRRTAVRPDFAASEATLRRQLVAGRHREEWEANVGAAEYRALRRLVVRAQNRGTRGGPRVYILPGIMGSRLGYRASGARTDTLLWIDPEEIQRGRLFELALPDYHGCRAVGVMVLNYLKLKLTLELAGFDVDFHPYDWRQGIDVLGHELHARLLRERHAPVALVAHSMGGLVGRMALSLDAPKRRTERRIGQVIMLATPHFGSFAPVMALRGVYPAVRKVATLDPTHSAESLTRQVFNTFPGLYHMLPCSPRDAGMPDWCDPAKWPGGTLAPRHALLRDARRARELLAGADERCALIVGVNQETVTAAARQGTELNYTLTRNGDGTVPLDLARLPGARTYYIDAHHGSIPANGMVCSAVVDLLRHGSTAKLPRSWRRRRGAGRAVSESALRQTDVRKHDWASLTLEQRRLLLMGLALPLRPKLP